MASRPDVKPPTGDGRRFEAHVFVCTEGAACKVDGPSAEILRYFKTQLKQSDLFGKVRFNKSGCLAQCGHGPIMVVYPEGTWYAHLTMGDAQRIWEEHFLGGHVVEDLVYHTDDPGPNSIPGKKPGEDPDTSRADYEPCTRCPWGPPVDAPGA